MQHDGHEWQEPVIELMARCLIEDLELDDSVSPEHLTWRAPIYADDYDFGPNPLDLDAEFEGCTPGDHLAVLRSLHQQIQVDKSAAGFIVQDGVMWTESHVWERSVTGETPGSLPWYAQHECADLTSLLGLLNELYDFADPEEDDG